MARKRSGLPRGLRGGSDARKFIDAVVAAGVPRENIELNGGGHLKITCPDGGVVTASPVLKTLGAYANARRDLAAHGIDIPARGGGGSRGHWRRQPRRPQPSSRQAGTVTRCVPGELYAFITADDGSIWFSSVPGDSRKAAPGLTQGSRVTFTGNPWQEPGKRYPDACDIRLAPPGEPGPVLSSPPPPPAAPRGASGSGEPASSLPVEFLAALKGIRGQLADGDDQETGQVHGS